MPQSSKLTFEDVNFTNGYLLLSLNCLGEKKTGGGGCGEKGHSQTPKGKRAFSSGKLAIRFMFTSAEADYILIKAHKLSRWLK